MMLRSTRLLVIPAGLGLVFNTVQAQTSAPPAPTPATSAVAQSTAASATPAANATNPPDEISAIVVTGTYIRQSEFANSSPIDVITHDAITDAAAVDIAHLFEDMPAVSGSSFNTGTAQSASAGGANINLRGLGAAATLVLIDGKRETQYPSAPDNVVDVNNLLPQIMIGRVDVLKDGASALYGTDAVGGVVNFVTRDQFNGVDFSAEGNRLTEASEGGYRMQGLLGGGDDKAHIVSGFEFDHVDPVTYQQLDGSKNFAYGTTPTYNYNVPTATGVKVVPDPNCGKVAESYLSGGICNDYFWPSATAVAEEDRFVSYTVATYQFTDHLRLRGEAGFAHDTLEDSSAAAAPLAQAVTVPADNPGNPFGTAVTTTTRIIGSQGGLPTGNSIPAGQFELNRPGVTINDTYRAGLTLDGDFSGWNWNVGGAYSTYHEDTTGVDQDVDVPNLVRALNGLGGPNCNYLTGVAGKGGCSYFNPFLGSAFATPGSPAANTAQLVNWIMPPEHDIFTSSLWQLDAVISGSPVDLPGGPLGVAVGGQWRQATQVADYDPVAAAGENENGVPSYNFSAIRDTKAVFIETNIPIFSNEFGKLGLNGAARHETSGGPLVSTDPKIGLIYSAPNSFVIARASWGKSFLAPSLFQEFSSTAVTSAVTEPNGALLRPTLVTTGNPDLRPETATNYSFGLELHPISSLSVGVTFWHVDFSNLIAAESPQQLLDQSPNSPQITRDPVTGVPTIISVSYFNASSVVTSGFDLDSAYKLDFDKWGNLNLVASATHVGQYELQATPGGPVVNGADNYNGLTFGSPSIAWKASGRATWQLHDNTVTGAVHYRGPFTNDEPLGTFGPNVASFTTIDLAYTYTLRQDTFHALGATDSIAFTAGATNLFDRVPPGGTFTYYFGNIDDYRGRIVYLRALAHF
jgi:iron complex outermembrane recepter protein